MSDFIEATISSTVTETEEFTIVGNCDIWVSELTSGSVKLQIKFPRQSNWRDVPNEKYTEDTFKTIFISESGVKGRLNGTEANMGAYMRLARHMNK